METVQIVLDKELLRAADLAARQTRRNRSALFRDALREHLRRLNTLALEVQDRQGYAKHPQKAGAASRWEREASWPAE